MVFNLFNNQKAKFEKSCELSALAQLEFLQAGEAFSKTYGEIERKRKSSKALELYQQAISVCLENPGPYWQAIAYLHREKKDVEAFDLFQKVTNLDYTTFLKFKDSAILKMPGATPYMAMLIPSAIGMLVALGKIDVARETLITQLHNLQRNNESLKSLDEGTFKEMLSDEILTLSFNDGKVLLGLLADTALEGYISVEQWQSYNDLCVEKIAFKAKFLIREDKLSDALACIDFVLGIEIKDFHILSREKFIALKKIILGEIEEANKWNLTRTNDEFLGYLFRRLAFKFHPDLAVDEKDSVEKTKIMQEINCAKDEKNLAKLKGIVNKHVPSWSKYLRKKK